MNWTNKLGGSIIQSFSVSIGGGKGYVCTKCDKFRKSDTICLNKIQVLNHGKVIETIKQLVNEVNYKNHDIYVTDDEINEYMQTKNYSNDKFNLLLLHTGDECESGKYKNLLDKIIYEHYYNGIYDDQICQNDKFIYCERSGNCIDNQSREWLTVWNELCNK